MARFRPVGEIALAFLLLSPGSALRVADGTARRPVSEGSKRLSHFDPLGLHLGGMEPVVPKVPAVGSPATLAIGLAALAAAQPEAALAKGGQYGVFEGRIISLVRCAP